MVVGEGGTFCILRSMVSFAPDTGPRQRRTKVRQDLVEDGDQTLPLKIAEPLDTRLQHPGQVQDLILLLSTD
jgi:hypothetical protein